MKKLLAVIGLGIIAISCGTKESSMSSSNTDSATVNNTVQSVPPTATDTTTTSTNPDTIKMRADSTTIVK
ncbi:cytochrome C551 [Chryseobacterium sp. FH2]|uniref:hypothetical protein n=1 Tax=Chryseobacterium sp. FH2 TaxID=1674291 RepID=UPI00065AC6A5|nr:hypothetical protein [Chryseobacterium sp. FH2]KMQ68708.1 cytochrome C551 [Chryseobacterium sp. FH2]